LIERLLKKLSAYFSPLLKNNTTVMPDGKSTSATDLSDYSEYNFWKDKDIDACEGEMNRNSLFLEFQVGNPLTTSKITYCNSAKFAAGYLKYIVLGDAAYMLLLSADEQSKFLIKDKRELENDYIPDIDFLLDSTKCKREKYPLMGLLEEIANLCNAVFIELNEEKALETFFNAAELCNRYFEMNISRRTGHGYSFKTYNGIGELEDLLRINCYDKTEIETVCNRENWDEKAKIIVKNVLDQMR